MFLIMDYLLYLIEILHQTTTEPYDDGQREKLYLIEILHQTTTYPAPSANFLVLYLIEILHQTTTYPLPQPMLLRCILSKFYIKPQLLQSLPITFSVVSYRNSTSNHNIAFNDKLGRRVVSYRNSTSNHNCVLSVNLPIALYLIEILHQTTTYLLPQPMLLRCILSKFYIKPQRRIPTAIVELCCILSKFYIKPQRRASY